MHKMSHSSPHGKVGIRSAVQPRNVAESDHFSDYDWFPRVRLDRTGQRLGDWMMTMLIRLDESETDDVPTKYFIQDVAIFRAIFPD